MSSDLRRSVESACWLCPERPVHVDAELREGTLPESLCAPLRLPPAAWVVIARIAWWLNCCRSPETRGATRERAARVADRLTALASAHGSLLVVGHGMFNRFVAAELRKRGWRGPGRLPGSLWGAARFEQTEAAGAAVSGER